LIEETLIIDSAQVGLGLAEQAQLKSAIGLRVPQFRRRMSIFPILLVDICPERKCVAPILACSGATRLSVA
jgi:hypothetical protein